MFLLFLSTTIFAQSQTSCQVVYPQFGVVSCEVFYGSAPLTETKSPNCVGDSCTFTFSCEGKAECQISSTDIQLSCDTWGYCFTYTLTKDGQNMGSYSSCTGGNPPQSISRFSSVTITGNCQLNIINYPKAPLSSNSRITMTYQNIYLYDTNPDWPKHKVDASVGCVPNGIMYKSGYTNQLPLSWIDSNGNIAGTKPSNLVDTLPTNMKVGETYSYFYSWREVSGINAIIGKDGNPSGYCGGSLGDRKLISFSQVTLGSSCYLVPTSIQKNVECCYNEDCKWKDPSGKLVCDPTTFTCTNQRPCNSDAECQVPGETYSCVNKVETSWSCDLTQKWYPYKGTCIKTTKSVPCCTDSDCPDPNNQYCDKVNGCQSKYKYSDCPIGKCCESGGNYKPKSCPSDLQCCHTGDPIVGECKSSCVEQKQEAPQVTGERPITGQFVLPIEPTMLVALIGIGVIGVGIYMFLKKKGVSLLTKTVPEHKTKIEGKVKYCTECGAKQDINKKYCTNCGSKLK